ncbi:hypothetical protein GOODEAATRI_005624 [Goodea atripinnis]|uniref:Ribosomal protein L2 n=1 Tax=Goodea atripinnis TaxID=208336 RepID=A0ABV0MYY1_9TELE
MHNNTKRLIRDTHVNLPLPAYCGGPHFQAFFRINKKGHQWTTANRVLKGPQQPERRGISAPLPGQRGLGHAGNRASGNKAPNEAVLVQTVGVEGWGGTLTLIAEGSNRSAVSWYCGCGHSHGLLVCTPGVTRRLGRKGSGVEGMEYKHI